MNNQLRHIDELATFSRERIEKGSKSFALAARLFPPHTRDSAYMLYAWCRHCDDVVDDQELGFNNPSSRLSPVSDLAERVEDLKRKTREACRQNASEPVFQALALVCARHAIPERHPLDLIAGFQMDADGRRYETIEDTLEYCYHVAGVVGVMMALVIGVKERRVLEHAADLGMAFQLTNIARDIVADHATGRIYLPAAWLRRAGLDHNTMALPKNREALASVAEQVLDAAEPYYQSAEIGVRHLPLRSAWAITTAATVYRDIGLAVRRQGAAAWDHRVSTSKAQKLGGVARGLGSAIAAQARPLQAAPDPARDGLWTKPDL